MAHLQNLGPKKWKIIIELGEDPLTGQRKRKTKTLKGVSEPEAKHIMAKLQIKYNDDDFIEPVDVTLSKHLAEWIDNHSKQIKPLTEESYRQQIKNHLVPYLGHLKLAKLTTKIIDDHYNFLLKEGKKSGSGGLSRRSVRYVHDILYTALDKAIEWQRIRCNPASNATPPKRANGSVKKIVTKELIEIINKVDNSYYKNIFEFTLRTGTRRGEVLGLVWDAINFDKKEISIYQALERLDNRGFIMQPIKQEKPHVIPIGEKVVKLLENIEEKQKEHKEQFEDSYKDDGLVFAREDGSPPDPDFITSVFGEYAKVAGYEGKYTFHDLRHGFATLQIEKGTHTKTLQELLGHADYGTTANIYSHVTSGPKTDAADKMDDAF